MASQDIQNVRRMLAAGAPDSAPSLADLRAQYEAIGAMFPLPEGVTRQTLAAGDVPAERLRGRSAVPGRLVLYFHGGAYTIGSPASHRHLAAAVGEAAEASVIVPDYRLAPEHPFPAAVEDALAVYGWLLEQGQDPAGLVIAGDSAGAGLALATLLSAHERRLPPPAAAVLISPWVDLANTGDTLITRQARDPIVQKAGNEVMARHYLGDRDPRTPLASPLYADLSGLPPLLIQVGSEECLLDDSLRLEQRARAQGVPTTIEVWEEMIHVWHFFHPLLQEGREAIQGIGQYVRGRVANALA